LAAKALKSLTFYKSAHISTSKRLFSINLAQDTQEK